MVINLHESSLHSSIKYWYSLPGDIFEARVENFKIDILRNEFLIEIQTRNFSAIKKKLCKLVKNYKVRLIYPIPERKWIVRVGKSNNKIISRRRSPKKGKLIDIFDELIRIPELIKVKNFSIEILLIEEEEVRCNDGNGSWRRKGVSIKDRKLIKVLGRKLFFNRRDFLKFLPLDLVHHFTNKILAKKIEIPLNKTRKITYCLRKMGLINSIRKNRKELLYKIAV